MIWVAVSWDLYQATKSATVLGNVGLVQVTPFLAFALFAGHVADRYDRRRTMLATQVLFLAASLVLVFGDAVGDVDLCVSVRDGDSAGVSRGRLGRLRCR